MLVYGEPWYGWNGASNNLHAAWSTERAPDLVSLTRRFVMALRRG